MLDDCIKNRQLEGWELTYKEELRKGVQLRTFMKYAEKNGLKISEDEVHDLVEEHFFDYMNGSLGLMSPQILLTLGLKGRKILKKGYFTRKGYFIQYAFNNHSWIWGAIVTYVIGVLTAPTYHFAVDIKNYLITVWSLHQAVATSTAAVLNICLPK